MESQKQSEVPVTTVQATEESMELLQVLIKLAEPQSSRQQGQSSSDGAVASIVSADGNQNNTIMVVEGSSGNEIGGQRQTTSQGGGQHEQLQAVASIVSADGAHNNTIMVVEDPSGNQIDGQKQTSNQEGRQHETLQALASIISADGTRNNAIMVVEDQQGNEIEVQRQTTSQGGSQHEQLQALASIVSADGTHQNTYMVVDAAGNQIEGQEGTVAQFSGEEMENVVVHFTETADGEQSIVVPVSHQLEEGEVVGTAQQVKRRRIEESTEGEDGTTEPEEIPGQELMMGKIFRYKCTMCSMMCESLEALEKHMAQELELKKFSCEDCGKRFKTREGYRCHRRIHTGETPYKCDECNLKFNNRTAHRYHFELKHSDEEFICLHCTKVFQTRQCLRKHLVLTHGKKLKTKAQKKAAKEKKKKLKRMKKLMKIKEEQLAEIGAEASDGEGIGVLGASGDALGAKYSGAGGDALGAEGMIGFEESTIIVDENGEHKQVFRIKMKKKKKKKKKRRLIKTEGGEVKLRCPRKTAHLIRAFHCLYCPGQYTLKKNLFKHIRAKHPEYIPPKPAKMMYSCDFCGVTMRTKTYKREHERIHTGEKPFNCRLGCEKSFSRSGARNEHERSVHLKENKATCEVCNKTFDRRELRHHATIHSGEKPFSCPYCQNAYTQKKIMNKHIRRAHPGSEVPAPIPRRRNITKVKRVPNTTDHALLKPDGEPSADAVQMLKERILQDSGVIEMQVYKCKYCEKLFNNLVHLTNHENIHIQTKHYQCGTCGKMFKRPEGLTRHIGKHTGGFQCATCGLNLPTFTKLQIHEEEHLFKCKMCKRKHETKAELIEHMKVHLKNTDRYQCMHCMKILATKSSLREHEKIHTEKVKCNFCSKEFVSHYMKKHLRTHSGDHPYICQHCPDRRYTTPNALRVHMRRRHSAAASRTDYQATIVINPQVMDKDELKNGKENEDIVIHQGVTIHAQVMDKDELKKVKEHAGLVMQPGVTIHDIEVQPQDIQMQVSQHQEIQHHQVQLQVSQGHANQQQVIQQVQVIPQEVVHQEVVPQQITQQQQVIPTHITHAQQVHVTQDGHVSFSVPNTYVQQQPPSYNQVTQQVTNSHITLTNVPQQQVYIDIPYNAQQHQQQPQQQQVVVQQQQVAAQQQQQVPVQQQFHYG